MCYAIPAKIQKIENEEATVDYGGVIKKVNVTLVEGITIGDYVLIHAGFIIEKLNKKSAEESLRIIQNNLSQFSKEDFNLEGKEKVLRHKKNG